MKFRLVSQFRLGKKGIRVILDDRTGEIIIRKMEELLVKTALISHPTLQELVLNDNDATRAVAENARTLKPIDPDEDVITHQPEITDKAESSSVQQCTFALTPVESPTNTPIPLLPQELWYR